MTIGKLSGQCDFGQKGQSYCNQRGQSCVAKRVKVAWLFQLLHPEILHLPHGMHPADLIERLLDAVSCLGIIAHYLARTHFAVPVCLPEYGGSAPPL